MRVLAGFVLILCLSLAATAAEAGKRVALVLSAQRYEFLRPLTNPDHDAQAVADALDKLGFEVTVEPDRSLKKMRRALDDFREESTGAEVALVYFAGHGVEIAGENRLLPVDADASSLDRLKETSLPLDEVRAAAAAVAPAVLIVLDACRDDPLGAGPGDPGSATTSRSARPIAEAVKAEVKPGLGRIGEAANTLFVFSAAPGKTASDGTGENSPFSAALAKYLPTDGLEIRSVLSLVQQEVYDTSKGRQSPWIESAPFPQFFFAAQTGAIPERERLLLAMADITPDLRDEVERVAAQSDVPLAPLYGALISADLKSLSIEDRDKKLTESARAYAETQDKLKTLSSSDPEVTRLRGEAEMSLATGALAQADDYLDQAVAVDGKSRSAIKENLIERTVSQAASLNAKAGVARTGLNYAGAIAAMEDAAALHAEIESLDVPDAARHDRDWLLADLGDLHLQVGDTSRALEAYQRMRAAAETRIARAPQEPDARRDLSVSLNDIGDVKVMQGDLAGALKAYSDGFAIRERLAARDQGNADWQRDLSVSSNRIGDVQVAQGDLGGALKAYSDGLAIAEALSARDPGNTDWQHDLSVSWEKIGNVKVAQGDLAGALKAYSDGFAIRQTLSTRHPDNTDWQRDLSVSLDEIGDVKVKQGDLAGALEAYADDLAITKALSARDQNNTVWQRDLSVSWDRIGDVRVKQGDLAGALKAYSGGLAIREALSARDQGNADWQRNLSVSWDRIGDVKVAQGDLAGALKAYSDGFAIREALSARDQGNTDWQRDLSVSWNEIGDVKVKQGDLAGALKAYSDGLAVARALSARDQGNTDWQRDLSVSLSKIGDIKVAQGDLAGGLKAYSDGLAIAKALSARDRGNTDWQRDLSFSWNEIGDVKLTQGDLAGALKAYSAGLVIAEALSARDLGNMGWQRDLSISWEKIGNVKLEKDDLAGALKAYSDGLAIRERLSARDPGNTDWQRDLIVSHFKLAQAGEDPRGHLTTALKIAESMQQKGVLSPADAYIPQMLRDKLAKLP